MSLSQRSSGASVLDPKILNAEAMSLAEASMLRSSAPVCWIRLSRDPSVGTSPRPTGAAKERVRNDTVNIWVPPSRRKSRLTEDVGVHELALVRNVGKLDSQTLDGLLILVMLILPSLEHGVLLRNLRLKILDLFVGGFLVRFDGLLVQLEVFLALFLQHINLALQGRHVLVDFEDLICLGDFLCEGRTKDQRL